MTDRCWLWEGATLRGYGKVHLSKPRRTAYVHRVAYEELVGPIPDGCQVHHRCHEPRCYNPAHLEVVTPVEHGLRHRRTHCKRGHSADNFGRSKSGQWWCRPCAALRMRESRARRAVAA